MKYYFTELRPLKISVTLSPELLPNLIDGMKTDMNFNQSNNFDLERIKWILIFVKGLDINMEPISGRKNLLKNQICKWKICFSTLRPRPHPPCGWGRPFLPIFYVTIWTFENNMAIGHWPHVKRWHRGARHCCLLTAEHV